MNIGPVGYDEKVPGREIFPNAPITEALLDIRTTLPAGTTLEHLASYYASVKDRYPEKRLRQRWQVGHELKPGSPPSILEPKGGPDGYIFDSADRKQAVQARLDGFTFNQLRPYSRWEKLRDEAMDLWKRYADLARPERINRLALRYINRIEVPLPMSDFRDYLLTGPEIAKNLPQGLADFFMRLLIPDIASRAVAIVTLTTEAQMVEGSQLPIIFDIDVYHEESLGPEGNDISKIFEQLRDFKNNIFFGSITEKCKGLFR